MLSSKNIIGIVYLSASVRSRAQSRCLTGRCGRKVIDRRRRIVEGCGYGCGRHELDIQKVIGGKMKNVRNAYEGALMEGALLRCGYGQPCMMRRYGRECLGGLVESSGVRNVFGA